MDGNQTARGGKTSHLQLLINSAFAVGTPRNFRGNPAPPAPKFSVERIENFLQIVNAALRPDRRKGMADPMPVIFNVAIDRLGTRFVALQQVAHDLSGHRRRAKKHPVNADRPDFFSKMGRQKNVGVVVHNQPDRFPQSTLEGAAKIFSLLFLNFHFQAFLCRCEPRVKLIRCFFAMVGILKKGDIIGIAAPSSPFDKNQFKHGVSVLKKLGFEVYHRDDIFSQERYLAGSDARRAEELTELFLKRDVKAIFFARGGYGSQRVIPHLKPDILKKHRKPVVGFSDLTALLTFLRQEAGIPTIYGPVLTQLGNKPTDRTINTLNGLLTSKEPLPPFDLSTCHILKEGSAAGELTGGCLSLITTSIGTAYELKMENSILFFEDVGEKVYALDRMLTQLKNADHLHQAEGILIGSLQLREGEIHSVEAMIKDVLGDFKGPIVANFPSGHLQDFFPLPLGTRVTLDTPAKKLVFEEPFLKQ